MNKEQYLNALRQKLRHMPEDEINDIMEYYIQYFEDAGVENEEAVIKELGSVSKLATQIMGNYVAKDFSNPDKTVKQGRNLVPLIILGIFASPIALPIAIAVLVVVLALVFSYFAVLFSFSITAIALFCSGVVTAIMGVVCTFIHIPTGVFFFGSGIFLTGLGLLLIIGMTKLFKISILGIGRFFSKRLARRNEYEA